MSEGGKLCIFDFFCQILPYISSLLGALTLQYVRSTPLGSAASIWKRSLQRQRLHDRGDSTKVVTSTFNSADLAANSLLQVEDTPTISTQNIKNTTLSEQEDTTLVQDASVKSACLIEKERQREPPQQDTKNPNHVPSWSSRISPA